MAPAAVRTAVIPVAGRGTRLLPVTKSVPKEMLPVVDRPCIEYVVAEAVQSGVERIVFVTSRGKDALLDYFDRSPSLEAHLEAHGKRDMLAEVRRVAGLATVVDVRQQVTRGLGHAVLSALPTVAPGEDVAVLLGDEILDADTPGLAQLLAARESSGAEGVVGLIEVPEDQTHRYGICAGSFEAEGRMRISEMIEKPDPADAPSRFAIIGKYVLPYRIFDVLKVTPPGRGGEVQLTDAIAVLARDGGIVGQVVDGVRHDTGNVLGLLRASLHFAWKRPELRPGVEALITEFADRR
jgi:UTP--glucose-1-phosphate uridylyltransferase